MSIRKLFIGSLAATLVSASAFASVFDYFEAIDEVIPDYLSISIEEKVKYETNIYEASRNETSGYIFTTGLNLGWKHETSLLRYKVLGSIGFDWCKRHKDLNQAWYRINPSILYQQGNWDLLVSASSKYEEDDVSVIDRRIARQFAHRVEADWNLNLTEKWGFGVNAYWSQKEFTNKTFKNLNYDVYGISVNPFYNLTGKTKVGLRAGAKWKKFHRANISDDSRTIFANMFVDYRVSGRLTLNAFAGVKRTDFDENNNYPRIRSSRRSNVDGKIGYEYGIGGKYLLCENLILSASLSRETEDTTMPGARSVQNDTVAKAGAAWKINPQFSVDQTFAYTWSDQENNNMDYTELRYSLHLSYAFINKRLTVFGGYEYEDVKYDNNSDVNYDNHIFTLGARYSF